jgi:hypothetical protein
MLEQGEVVRAGQTAIDHNRRARRQTDALGQPVKHAG